MGRLVWGFAAGGSSLGACVSSGTSAGVGCGVVRIHRFARCVEAGPRTDRRPQTARGLARRAVAGKEQKGKRGPDLVDESKDDMQPLALLGVGHAQKGEPALHRVVEHELVLRMSPGDARGAGNRKPISGETQERGGRALGRPLRDRSARASAERAARAARTLYLIDLRQSTLSSIFPNSTRVTVGKFPELSEYSASTTCPREIRAYSMVIGNDGH